MSVPTAEEKKELGNKAFAAKEYDEAIKHYTAAIALDSKNCVYYSNRSACHGGKQEWATAAQDAKECIKTNPSFIKGYYRLANAQSEQNDCDAALATIKQGLAIDAENPQLQKQMRQVKAKRAALRRAEQAAHGAPPAGAVAPHRPLDPAASKEVRDLQLQLIATTKEYRMAKAHLARAQNAKRSHEITRAEVDHLPQDAEPKMYRGVGKMFMRTSRADLVGHLEATVAKEGKAEKDLAAKLDYLERRMKSQQQNIVELTTAASTE